MPFRYFLKNLDQILQTILSKSSALQTCKGRVCLQFVIHVSKVRSVFQYFYQVQLYVLDIL